MRNRIKNILILFYLSGLFCSCANRNISKYYFENQKILDSIHQSYKEYSKPTPFSILFTDRSFTNVSIEIFTDTLKYIYEFNATENRLKDTLQKYNLPVSAVKEIITQMQTIHCTWINNLDYYVDRKKNNLVFMSIRPTLLNFPFTNKKYYILTYFQQPQYYDSEGRLLDHRQRKRIRKINEDVFRRITDKVAYTISDRFR